MTPDEYHTLIKEMPEDERPRERLELYGEGQLSVAELLAITLHSGSRRQNAVSLAHRLLKEFPGLAALSRASVKELCAVPGIGPAKAAQIKAAFELGRRAIPGSEDSRPQITCPDDAFKLLLPTLGNATQEELHVLLLDTRNRVQRTIRLYVGNVNASIVRPGEVFREAIRDTATAIIIAHNHPSGDPAPSPEDVRITNDVYEAGRLLEIKLLDHLIIGKHRFLSLKQLGLGFGERARVPVDKLVANP